MAGVWVCAFAHAGVCWAPRAPHPTTLQKSRLPTPHNARPPPTPRLVPSSGPTAAHRLRPASLPSALSGSCEWVSQEESPFVTGRDRGPEST